MINTLLEHVPIKMEIKDEVMETHDEDEQQATEVAQKFTQVKVESLVTKVEDEEEHLTENHIARTGEHGQETPIKEEMQDDQIIQPKKELNENSDDVILNRLNGVTAAVIPSSIQIIDTSVTAAEIPVVLTEQSLSAHMPKIGEVVSVLSLSHSGIAQEVQETPESSSPPCPLTNRKTRKRRSPQIQKVDLEDNSPNKRPKRNTRKTIQPKIEEPETKPIVKSLPRPTRSVANRKKETPAEPVIKNEAIDFTPAAESETEPEPSTSSQSRVSTRISLTKKIKKEKENKPRRNSVETKIERDSSPQILPSDSQLSERDEEFIEDRVADIVEKTQPIINEFGEKRFVCDQCPQSFKKHARLVHHRRIHTGEKPFTCDECGKKFRIRNLLNEHKLRHSKEKKFICEICNLGCCTKQDYKQHMRHHANDRRFQCSMCPKAFVRNADLKIHFRVHTGEKPFVCDICHKCFRANQNLGVHKKSHIGEESYKCEYCEKNFRRKIECKAHIERDHASEKVKKKPGPKPNALKAELEQQRKLIEELQSQLKRQIKTEEVIIPADSYLNDSSQDESIMETSNPLPEGFEIVYLTQPKNLTAIPSPPCMSMQVENVTTSAVSPEKKTTGITSVQLTSKTTPPTSTVKKEQKITSYFTVLNQKAEV